MPAASRDGRVWEERNGQRCTAITRDGTRCGAWAIRGRDLCFVHRLSRVERLASARKANRASQVVRAVKPPKDEAKPAAPAPLPERPALAKKAAPSPAEQHARTVAQLERVRAELLELYEAGRIAADELPPDLYTLVITS
jgi:hypothetical protein